MTNFTVPKERLAGSLVNRSTSNVHSE